MPFQQGSQTNPGLDPRVSHMMCVTFLTVCVHFIDRQADYINRLDFCWKRQLMDEQDEANTTRMVNKMLLRNILPNHVGEPSTLAESAFLQILILFASISQFYFFNSHKIWLF